MCSHYLMINTIFQAERFNDYRLYTKCRISLLNTETVPTNLEDIRNLLE